MLHVKKFAMELTITVKLLKKNCGYLSNLFFHDNLTDLSDNNCNFGIFPNKYVRIQRVKCHISILQNLISLIVKNSHIPIHNSIIHKSLLQQTFLKFVKVCHVKSSLVKI